MISHNSVLAVLIGAMALTSPTFATPTESRVTYVENVFNSLATDFDVVRDLYDENAELQFCWGGTCVKGSVNDAILPFHHALKSFTCQTTPIAGENEQVMSLFWNNHMETNEGCSQVTHGIATFEFNDKGKVIKHLSLSDDTPRCVKGPLAGVATSENVA